MANPEHVEVVRQGAEAIRAWRERNESALLDPPDLVDLADANLVGANLADADLTDANLTDADLGGANLTGANLTGAKLSDARLIDINLSGANLSDARLAHANLNGANLTGANLTGANLTGANLSGARLTFAELIVANLTRADLTGADLTDANLSGDRLTHANLSGADLTDANLTRADLSGTDLTGANLSGTNLKRAVLTNARCYRTAFNEVDLSDVTGLDSIRHAGPSSVGIDTLAMSKGRIPDAFLRGCGLSDWEILAAKLYTPGLGRDDIDRIIYEISTVRSGSPIQISPLFISYSHADAAFVGRLEDELSTCRIRFWRDVHGLTAGPVEKQLERAIAMNPTFVLVLSQHSASSDWVEWEATKAREAEKALGRHVLCPIALDDSWKTSAWSGPLRNQIAKYYLLDFSGWQDEDAFKRQFGKLIEGLGLFYGDGGKRAS